MCWRIEDSVHGKSTVSYGADRTHVRMRVDRRRVQVNQRAASRGEGPQ